MSDLNHDFNSDNLIAELHRLLSPPPLSDIQLRVLRYTLEGLTYTEMSNDGGYEESYLRDVGSKLWKRLSIIFKTRITKNNLRSAMVQYLGDRPEQSLKPLVRPNASIIQTSFLSTSFPEFPCGPVSLSSEFYIARPPLEESAYAEISKPGALIRIRGPRKVGKNSLMLRILSYAITLNYRTVWLDLQQADDEVFSSLDRFLRWLATLMSRRLGLPPRLDDYWDMNAGSKVSCTLYLQNYLLSASEAPLVVALNEVNRLFDHRSICQEFLPLLRSWFEEAKQVEQLQKLRLIIVHSTEDYLKIATHQSPFNVGLSVRLPEFTADQVRDLACRHGLDWSESDHAERLMSLVGGHPHLIRIALYHLCQGDVSLDQLLAEAASPQGIYGDHLTDLSVLIQDQPDMLAIIRQMITTDSNVYLEPGLARRLDNLGIVKRDGNRITIRNRLYQMYFSSQTFNFGCPDASITTAEPPEFALGQRVSLSDGRFAYIVGLAFDPQRQAWEYCILPVINSNDFDEMVWCDADELRL